MAQIIQGLGSLSIMISLREVHHELEREEDCDMEPATRNKPITIVKEEESYEDLNVSTAMTTTSGYSTVGVKNKQGSLDCLQECGVQPVSAKRHFVTETMGAEKESVTVTETEDVEMCDVSKASAQGDTGIKDADNGFVRAMDESIPMVRPGSPSYTFQPPTHSTD
jgi:hypothetical protein